MICVPVSCQHRSEHIPPAISKYQYGQRVNRSYLTYVEHSSDCVEEPAVRIDLLLVFRLDDQDNLHGDQV